MSVTLESRLRSALSLATLAPSGHNAQPWLFRVGEKRIDLFADLRRRLPVIDPQDRELIMSCGAALLNLRLALEHEGYRSAVEVLPEPTDASFLARVTLEEGEPVQDTPLYRAIPERRTHRLHFADRAVTPEQVSELGRAAEEEGARLACLQGGAQEQVADLIRAADLKMATDAQYRAELEQWLISQHTLQKDGDGVTHFDDFSATLAPLIVRFTNWGTGAADKNADWARRSPLLAVLCTEDDSPATWVAAGQALQRTLLTGAAQGIHASYLNQPLEFPELRTKVQALVGGWPQLILRLGHGARPLRAAPRRPLEEVLIP